MFVSVLVFILVLSLLILIHEAGHYFVAKASGVFVEEFGFGLPPRIWGKKVGETLYSINLLPFGGFVRLHGEMSDEGVTQPERAFLNKSKKKRAAIILAGVFMNFVLAVVAFSIVYSFSGIPKDTNNVKILEVDSGSPAQAAGVTTGDIVRKVGDTDITSISQFTSLVNENKGRKIKLEVQRKEGEKDATKTFTVTPRENPPEGQGALGVYISSTEVYYPPVWQRPFVGVYYGFKDALYWGKTVVVAFAGIFGTLLHGHAPAEVGAGPVGIFAITSAATAIGALSVINLLGILSVNLAILNIIPFPALDGGRLFFIGIEAVIGKKVLPKVEATVHTIGMIILIILLLAITVRDVERIRSAGGISGFVQQVLQ